jgi:hypothetical protein
MFFTLLLLLYATTSTARKPPIKKQKTSCNKSLQQSLIEIKKDSEHVLNERTNHTCFVNLVTMLENISKEQIAYYMNILKRNAALLSCKHEGRMNAPQLLKIKINTWERKAHGTPWPGPLWIIAGHVEHAKQELAKCIDLRTRLIKYSDDTQTAKSELEKNLIAHTFPHEIALIVSGYLAEKTYLELEK